MHCQSPVLDTPRCPHHSYWHQASHAFAEKLQARARQGSTAETHLHIQHSIFRQQRRCCPSEEVLAGSDTTNFAQKTLYKLPTWCATAVVLTEHALLLAEGAARSGVRWVLLSIALLEIVCAAMIADE